MPRRLFVPFRPRGAEPARLLDCVLRAVRLPSRRVPVVLACPRANRSWQAGGVAWCRRQGEPRGSRVVVWRCPSLVSGRCPWLWAPCLALLLCAPCLLRREGGRLRLALLVLSPCLAYWAWAGTPVVVLLVPLPSLAFGASGLGGGGVLRVAFPSLAGFCFRCRALVGALLVCAVGAGVFRSAFSSPVACACEPGASCSQRVPPLAGWFGGSERGRVAPSLAGGWPLLSCVSPV